MRRKGPSIATQIVLFPPPAPPHVALGDLEQQELIRALAELLLLAAGDTKLTTAAKGAQREDG